MRHYKIDPASFDRFGIPEHMRDAITCYVEQGINGGNFLSAVVNNDLRLAVMSADDINVNCLPAYVAWFSNCAPAWCWGSGDATTRWPETLKRLSEHP